MTAERIIKNIQGWIEQNEGDIAYRKRQIQEHVQDITRLQTQIEDYERRNKENREAIEKLLKEDHET